jgi:hypothetical protein
MATKVDFKRELRQLYDASREPQLVDVPFLVKGAPGGVDYGVLPLEGPWWTADMAKFSVEDKSAWDWTMMIMQPDVVTAEIVEQALAKTAKKGLAALGRLRLERFAEGSSVQIMHVGPYATEQPTIQRLHAFIAEQGLHRRGKHHEIYLSDPRRTAPEHMKTIIRRPVTSDEA